ncbi:UPF0426 protein At1g28150, chloroplastic [Olea europaea var. sylvestris]|uniref:UPF0426 protein At1g28150, chloroplastic n=1 Tax=Olea europaea var. sylvestris TaxID=158386 RepID=UPI000C1CE026|nr:UPF0426 protein At1g28150, chloroplastic [Olea europaea var. sylvestris]
MSLLLNVSAVSATPRWKAVVPRKQLISSFPSSNSCYSSSKPGGFRVRAFIYNPTQDPLVKEALKEPVAFLGGMFAGFLRLDLNEDPLKEWVARTVDASAIAEEEISGSREVQAEDMPQQIEIE